MNRAILVGKIVRDPEYKNVTKSFTVLQFTVNTYESYKDKNTNETKYKNEYTTCKLKNKAADVFKDILRDKQQVSIEGSIKTESWEDAKSGLKKFQTVVDVEKINVLSGYEKPKQDNNSEVFF